MSFRSPTALLLVLLAQACGGQAAGARGPAAGAGGIAAGAEGVTAGAGSSGSGAGGKAPEAGASGSAGAGSGAGAGGGAGAASSAGAGGIAAGGASSVAGAGGSSTGDACEPTSAVPETASFQAPEVGPLGAYQVTFHNQCGQTVWPAWGSSGGLDFSVIDQQLWLPMPPASERNVTVYGGVREVGFWGRTGCSFDQAGTGACQTGECGGFVCPIKINEFPPSATVFVLDRGFLGGYNVGLHVVGSPCGDHACVADVHTCSPMSTVSDACGRTIACNDLCGSSPAACCRGLESSCTTQPLPGGAPDVGDLVITFCP